MSPLARSPLMLEHALLGFVRQRPTHAYEIHQMLQHSEKLGLVWHLKQSQLYALLTRLEESGYLASTTEPQGSRPPRKILHLTEEGHAAFEEWVSTPVEHGRDFRLEFLAKLFFARQQGTTTAAQLIASQRRACEEWLAELHAKAARSSAESYDWLVLQFRVGQINAVVDWLTLCETTLASDE
ncbi:MAG TPA: PadR family transcriptional regulator [Roseiflexaceae bacterium]|nr:PadR family transcriptional regulator [Roseiflexaceae bacterium]